MYVNTFIYICIYEIVLYSETFTDCWLKTVFYLLVTQTSRPSPQQDVSVSAG